MLTTTHLTLKRNAPHEDVYTVLCEEAKYPSLDFPAEVDSAASGHMKGTLNCRSFK